MSEFCKRGQLLLKILKMAKSEVILSSITAFGECVCSFLVIVLTKYVFEVFLQDHYSVAAIVTSCLCLSILGTSWLLSFNNFYSLKLNLKCSKILSEEVALLLERISPENYEDVTFLNDVVMAKKGIEGVDQYVSTLLMVFCFFFPYYVMVSIYMYYIHPMLTFIIFLVFVPVIMAQKLKRRIVFAMNKSSNISSRQSDYFADCIHDRRYAKEIRNYECSSFIFEKWEKAVKEYIDIQRNARRKMAIQELGLKCLTFSGYAGVVFLATYLVVLGKINVASMAAVFSALGLLFAYSEELFGYYLGELNKVLPDVCFLSDFLNNGQKYKKSTMRNISDGISVRHVSFRYPGGSTNAIHDISFTLNGGETLAIVGANGAGKSTLVKLLLGFFEPNEGEIVENVSLKKAKSTAVFQNHQKYKLTLYDNVILGESGCNDKNRIIDCLKEVNLNDVKNELLAPEYGGVELSGGQWQRLAMARAIYKDYLALVFDEPTSAIDPAEEESLYQKIKEWVSGHTAIIVTHRIGMSKIADKILVLDEGRAIEYGTFEELMSMKGEFYKIFMSQSKWFQEKSNEYF